MNCATVSDSLSLSRGGVSDDVRTTTEKKWLKKSEGSITNTFKSSCCVLRRCQECCAEASAAQRISFDQTQLLLDSTEQVQERNGSLEGDTLSCRGRRRLTSAERPPALPVQRSSHRAASWSLIWAVAGGLCGSWLSGLGGGSAALSLALAGCVCKRCYSHWS